MEKIKTIFTGTPEFATYYLNAILKDDRFEIIGVVTQSDKPSGRKKEIIPSAVKKIALENNIPVFQPEKLKEDTKLLETLKCLEPDLMIVVAYGQIIPKEILQIFKFGTINVHPSLLPKLRGASPVQSVILNGENKTGVTIMLMDEKMDHGPILSQIELPLTGEETNMDLHKKLADSSRELLIDTIFKYLNKEIEPKEQKHEEATFCKIISRENAQINWSKSAEEIKRMIYAFDPWPGTWTTLNNKRVKIFPPVNVLKNNDTLKPGSIVLDYDLKVKCGEGAIKINRLQLEGKKEIEGLEFINGHKESKHFI